MKAGPTTLKRLIEGQKQYRVPIFQRPYTWTGVELQQLWTDILAQYDGLADPDGDHANPIGSPHFFGSFVLAPVPGTVAHAVAPYLVVDGQQRLVTMFLALAALRDLVSEAEPTARDKYDRLYLKNEYAEGLDKYKVLPSRKDRAEFIACMDRASGDITDSGVRAAYEFFIRRMRSGAPLADGVDPVPFDLELLQQVIVDRLAVVDITCEPEDDPYRIFSSLNGTGVGLTQADLLRNYVFMILPSRGEEVYDKVWYPMEVSLGTEANLEGLARVDLQRRGLDATRDDVYRLHQERLEDLAGHEDQIVREVEDLARQARFYLNLIEPGHETDLQVRAALTRLNRWGAQTTYPLLMQMYSLISVGKSTVLDLDAALGYIESFLVRRFLCQVPTKQLSRLFVDLVKFFDGARPVGDVIREQLSGSRRYWPTDDQVRAAIVSRPFYLMGRADQRRMVLERLEESYEHKEAVTLGGLKLSVEHVLPQTLSENWQAELREAGEDPDELFAELGHTMGNLSLTAYNGELSNNLFERKKQIFNDSNLQLNRELARADNWGRREILDRGARLADRCVAIWTGPLPGSTGVVLGFDWSRIDSAVMAIPQGRWTSYGELAALGKTHPQPVGVHMSSGKVPNAHRVLDAQGAVVEGFRWPAPDDTRDVHDVLAAEGVPFRPDGGADRSAWLSAYDLAQLIPYELEIEEAEELKRRSEAIATERSQAGADWLVDGETWHFAQIKSPSGRELLRGLVALVESSAAGLGPAHWEQKYYVAWRNSRGRTWLAIHPRQQWMWLDLWGAHEPAADIAQELQYAYVAPGSVVNSSYNGPSQVVQLEGEEGVSIQIRHVGDLTGSQGDRIRTLIRGAWTLQESHPTASQAEDGDSGTHR